jgi:hypothetical protein
MENIAEHFCKWWIKYCKKYNCCLCALISFKTFTNIQFDIDYCRCVKIYTCFFPNVNIKLWKETRFLNSIVKLHLSQLTKSFVTGLRKFTPSEILPMTLRIGLKLQTISEVMLLSCVQSNRFKWTLYCAWKIWHFKKNYLLVKNNWILKKFKSICNNICSHC